MNHVPSPHRAIAAVPPLLTRRCAPPRFGGSFADVFDSTSRPTRSLALTPSHCPTMPPIEMPAKSKRDSPAASATASASRASISIV